MKTIERQRKSFKHYMPSKMTDCDMDNNNDNKKFISSLDWKRSDSKPGMIWKGNFGSGLFTVKRKISK